MSNLNQKTLKGLRKMVRNLAASQKEAGSPIPERVYQESTNKRKYMTAERFSEAQKEALGELYDKKTNSFMIASGQVVLAPNCQRAIYQHFKKKMKVERSLKAI